MRHANVALFVPHAGCPHRCAFCDQRGISGRMAAPDNEEIARTLREGLENLGERMRGGMAAEIAFFGGSFTAIPRGEMLRLLRAAKPFLGSGGYAGVRVSTRPDAIDAEVLGVLREYGVTAIELGAQSMDDRVLAMTDRGHTAADVQKAAEMIRAYGFSLGLQMMTGLPGDDDQGALATAEALNALAPDTVRIYPTLVLDNSALAVLWRSGRYYPQTLEQATLLCARLLAYFSCQGVRVIRLGLHDGPELRGGLLAGPYHPAFRELAEGKVLLQKALAKLKGRAAGPVTLVVAQGAASKMAGQRRCNTLMLAEKGYVVRIIESDAIGYLELDVI